MSVRLPPMENPRSYAAPPMPAPLYTPYLTPTYMGKYFVSNYKQNFYGNPVNRSSHSFLPAVNPKPYFSTSFVKQG